MGVFFTTSHRQRRATQYWPGADHNRTHSLIAHSLLDRNTMDASQQDDGVSTAATQEPATAADITTRPAQASERAQSAGELEAQEPASTQPASEPSAAAGSESSGERQLNVTDALGYLDTVKSKFHDQPEVYSNFLDIMKDFKNQVIDTPGVIKRVSHLFNGHFDLIQGFNAFLPAGYRIVCSPESQDGNYITVTTPSGTTMQAISDSTGNGAIQWSISGGSGVGGGGSGTGDASGGDVGMLSPSPTIPTNRSSLPSALEESFPREQSFFTDPRVMAVDDITTDEIGGPAMQPAVNYVKRIRQKCDPETYKQFLEILSQYHHRPESVDEREVSEQIAQLFKDNPDLRSEFRMFMPERGASFSGDLGSALAEPRVPEPGPSSKRRGDEKPPSESGPPPSKRKRKPADREPVPSKASTSSIAKPIKKSRSHHEEPSSSSRHGTSKRSGATVSGAASASPDETHFFDRVKRSVENRETYNEFLKLVNLFTQGYIDTAQLVRESRPYLGETDLMRQFRDILGWDEHKEREAWLADNQDTWVRQKVYGGVLDRPTRAELNIRYGSYRKLPPSEANVLCSGRDEMCRSVLNDEWVSHPTWTSEDPGPTPHKKNAYEEALHRSEEERHEYDFHIEAIVRTIATLEPISNKIAQLTPEERGNFKLKANLGGAGKAIHHRLIKKIYGREAGQEVIQAMQSSPVLAIPVVLSRLKQKEEEWKRAQREWNKVWREVDARNYQKSLDHQAIVFKAADKKAITARTFINQIEVAREEQMARRTALLDPLFARTRPRHQLEFVMNDVGVFQDALKLTFSFLDRTQGQISMPERKKIEVFLRSFITLFFVLDIESFNAAFNQVQEVADSDLSDEVASAGEEEGSDNTGGHVSSRPTVRSGERTNGTATGEDLRKKLLKSEQAKSTKGKTKVKDDDHSPSGSRNASPAPAAAGMQMDIDDMVPSAISIASDASRLSPRRYVFYGNALFYTLLRLIELLYSRLRGLKLASAKKVSTQQQQSAQDNPNDAQKFPPWHYYIVALNLCERLFDNDIEQSAFEDQLRQQFGIQTAFKLFTIDKLIGALIKQVQLILSDGKSDPLLEALKRERAMTTPSSTQDLTNLRRNAERTLGPDENLFRIDWHSESKLMTIQLFGKEDDNGFDDAELLAERWQNYIDSYVSSEPTKDVIRLMPIPRPFLKRNLPTKSGETLPPLPPLVARGGLEIKICVRTYRPFFVSHTEDVLFRKPLRMLTPEASEQLKERKRKKVAQIGAS